MSDITQSDRKQAVDALAVIAGIFNPDAVDGDLRDGIVGLFSSLILTLIFIDDGKELQKFMAEIAPKISEFTSTHGPQLDIIFVKNAPVVPGSNQIQ